MNGLINTSTKTPIEMVLGIDEKGMTTARKLYEFLELAKGQFSRWYKANILENDFAEEGIDYTGFDINVEGNEVKDYKLTAAFAKKLSMTAKNEKGEQARQYFIQTEDKLKGIAIQESNLSPELQMFSQLFKAIATNELASKQAIETSQQAIAKVESIKEVISLDTTSWRGETGNMLRKISMEQGGGQAYSQVRSESYELLNKRFGVALDIRLTNKRRRMAEEGISRSKRNKMSYLDIIAEDKKLIEGYVAIVKEMAIKYGIA